MNVERLLGHYREIAEAPDAIAHLRRFILDLSVRGKLVSQDANDESASELLKRIALEKARLEKAGQARKSEVDPVIEGEVPFPLPVKWVWTRLGSIADWGAGSTPPRGNLDFYGGGVTWLKSGELNDNRTLAGSEETVTQLAIEKGSFRINRPGDVLIAMYGATIGKVAILAENAVTNQAVCGCTPFAGVFNEFLFLFLLSQREQFRSASEGGAQPNISKVKIVRTPFPLPPLAEQHRIVAKVDELMALCDQLEAARMAREAVRDRLAAASFARLNAPDPDTFQADARVALDALPALTARPDQINQLRQTILNLAVRGKLVPQDANDQPASELLNNIAKEKQRLLSAGEIRRDQAIPSLSNNEEYFAIPTSWKWCRLRTLATTLGDGLHGTPNYSADGDCFFINGNNLEDGRIAIKPNTRTVSVAEMQKHRRPLNSNSVLVSINGTLGKVAFYNGEKIILGKSACYFNLTEFTEKKFVKVVLDSPYFAEYAVRSATGTTIMNLSLRAMNEFPFPLAPLAEQHRIVAKVDQLMTLCDRLEASLTAADDTRGRLLEALLAEALATNDERELEAAE